jgi:cyclase
MPLATRIIPTLLMRGHTLVKGRQFNSWRVVGHVMQAARIHAARQVDELILLDIGATPEGRGPDLELVGKLAGECFTPLTVGGGIKSVEDVRRLLLAGADKVAICTALFHTHILEEAAGRFGCQALVAAIDVKDLHVRSDCGQKPWAMRPEAFARMLAETGAGEILLTSIDREGTMEGYDLELIKRVSHAVDIPVVAHGGAGTYQHMLEAVQHGASAVAAGAMFQFTEQTPEGAAQYLAAHGVTTRTKEEA